MSHQVSNLYAAKIYAEHPLGLWPLDDDFAFQSVLSNSNKNIQNWTRNNLKIVTSYTTPSGIPMEDEITKVVSLSSSMLGITASATTSSFTTNSLDTSKDSICISAYVYAYSDLVESYEIGYYYDSTKYSKIIANLEALSWQKISYTENIPNTNTISIIPFIKINYQSGGPTTSPDYDVAINGLSIGQWSEPYNTDTTGSKGTVLVNSTILDLLPNTSASTISYVTADSYGISSINDGYYIIDNNKMLAINSNLPMVFGSSNITNIQSPVTEGMPSIILPGNGFLNSSGQFLEMTIEFWLRIYTESSVPIKIFGPLSTQDGLYVEEEYLTLRVGNYVKSYYVGKWNRPMLIDLRYSSNIITLLINGDLALELIVDTERLQLQESIHDYLGFFGHEDVYPFDLDCVAIYSYVVPEQIAKRRFIYGQGVDVPENIVSNFDGESIYIDFPYSKYTSTINYPDMNPWNGGFFNNIDATSKYIRFPQYNFPELIFEGDTSQLFNPDIRSRLWNESDDFEWYHWAVGSWNELKVVGATDFYIDNYTIQDEQYPFLKMRPNSDYNNLNSTIFFESINTINEPVKSIFGVFKTPDVMTETEQIVMQFTNKINSNIFKVTISNEGMKYLYNDIEVAREDGLSASTNFVVGFDIETIASEYSTIFGNFFTNPQNISLNLGGYGSNIFEGKIYGLNFNNRLFTDKDLSSYINEYGFFNQSQSGYLYTYIGNYKLSILESNSSMALDIGAAGYWEDSMPLSYFGKYIQSGNGTSYYDLDMLQFNIDYPSPLVISNNEITSTEDDFRIKTYITLQNYADVGNTPYSNYTQTEIIGSNRVLDFDNTEDIITTKFEVVDGTVIFPPKELIDFKDYYITMHVEARTKGIYIKQLLLKRMSLMSLAFDERDFYAIGTRTGNNIYPFTRYDNNYQYKDKNPFTIYKDSTQYLYLTGDSGISVLDYNTKSDRGISIPINQEQSPDYLLGGVQLWMFYNLDHTINETLKISRITSIDKTVDIYLIPEDNNKRGRIAAYNPSTGLEDINVQFYQNGELVENPYIMPLMWNSILISFGTSLDLDSYIGQVELYKGFVFNNIALYKKSTDILGTTTQSFSWQNFRQTTVIIDDETLTTSETWQSKIDNLWNEFIEEVVNITYTVDGQNIYESYLGLPKVISNDSSALLVNSDGVNILTNVIWDEYSGKPV
jgi:hypothetical protein